MRIATVFILFAAVLSLFGCTGTSEEQRDREDAEDQAAAQRAETFSRSLPPAR